jgi:hypothetical protein
VDQLLKKIFLYKHFGSVGSPFGQRVATRLVVGVVGANKSLVSRNQFLQSNLLILRKLGVLFLRLHDSGR